MRLASTQESDRRPSVHRGASAQVQVALLLSYSFLAWSPATITYTPYPVPILSSNVIWKDSNLRKLNFCPSSFHLQMFDFGLGSSLPKAWCPSSVHGNGAHIYLASWEVSFKGVMLWLFSSLVNAQYYKILVVVFTRLVSSFQLLYLKGIAENSLALDCPGQSHWVFLLAKWSKEVVVSYCWGLLAHDLRRGICRHV